MRKIWAALLLLMCIPGWCVDRQEQWLSYGMGVPVLLYHGILEQPDRTRIYEISVDSFRKHMGALKLAGYTTITTRDLLDFFQKKKRLPKKSVLITFDDGEKTSYYLTDAILKEMGFQAVMFVIPLMQENQYPAYLSWEELNQMHQSGRWDIQTHGYKYHNIIKIDAQGTTGNFASNLMWLKDQNRLETIEEYKKRLIDDLYKQKQIIESNVAGVKVIAFAYPFGDIGDSAENLDATLATAINITAVNTVFPLSFGTVYFEGEDYTLSTSPHLINRLIDGERYSAAQLIEFLQKVEWEKG
jgi:peptidoglycan/xylan/chitin deacetylase (PgdA/CDA1 family)